MNRRTMLLVSAAALFTLSTATPIVALAGGKDAVGAVYTMTNAPTGNAVLIFDRDSKGELTPAGSVPTGGLGSGGGGDPLISQGSLILTDNNRFLIAVNAGSDDVSVFRVKPDGLEQTDQVASGGIRPVSVAVFHDVVYILNQDTPNITGFVLNHQGELDPLANSTRTLAAGSYAQVGFTPDGDHLVVTGRTVNTIVTFGVDHNGRASAGYVTNPSSGAGPFGFTFDRRGNLLVAEAGVNAVSSYKVRNNGMLDVIDASVPNGQTATCWITDNGKYYFTANPGTHTFSTYSGKKGNLELQDGAAGTAARPLDMGVSKDGRFLYALDSSALQIVGFEIAHDGSLVPLTPAPAAIEGFAQGLAAR